MSTKWFRMIALVAGVLSTISLIAVALHGYGIPPSSALPDGVNTKTYQAVLLDTDQVYFGHIKEMNSRFLLLEDVYYVQVPGGTTQGRLVRLGDIETHGPENRMFINQERVLFWENLRSDSVIIQTIRAYRPN